MVSVLLAILWAWPVSAQTFSSGSTGADGVFAPTASTTVPLPPSGVFNFTTVTIPAGVTVTFARNVANTPVTMLATGDVTVAGTIDVSGSNGLNASSSGPFQPTGGAGGPGGFAGGQAGARNAVLPATGGQGPGGGGLSGLSNGFSATASANLLPLIGGSGGGGTNGSGGSTGNSGGGGGGAIVIASSTKIVVNGAVLADGGSGGVLITTFLGDCVAAGGGSGGTIRLVAPQIGGTGSLSASGQSRCGVSSPPGRVRLEAFNVAFAGGTTPSAAVSLSTGPVTATSNPGLIKLPSLMITAIGGVAPPAAPTGTFATPDVVVPAGVSPVTVTLAATNTPVGSVFTVRLITQSGTFSTINSTASTGTFASSTATASVPFPTGPISLINVFSSFTLTASLFPQIDGEPVERVMVAATYGEPSTVTLITKSGKEVRVDTLTAEVQLAFAKGLEAMQRER